MKAQDGAMQTQLLDFAEDDQQAGFRLERFELLNWGTFDKTIWSISPKGNNALLTGDIGSGKSTLVDALTTLMVPTQKITFNKAAGAENKERSLRSYVLGYYKSEKDDNGIKAKPVGLRKAGNYSILLAQFKNEGFDQWLTLAQVFWLKPGTSNPERFYLVADTPLTIREHFNASVGDIGTLKRQLNKRHDISIFDSFSQYSADFRRKMGIESRQAMSLFYQTVSMKAVGNLTDFVRSHMLDTPPIADKLEQLIRSFDDLNRAHEAVLKAQRQIDQLVPLDAHWQEQQQLAKQVELFSGAIEHLEPFFAHLKQSLLDERMMRFRADFDKAEQHLKSLETSLETLHQQANSLRMDIAKAGGERIQQLANDISRHQQDKGRLQKNADHYAQLCQQLKLETVADEDRFIDCQRHCQDLAAKVETTSATLTEQRDQFVVTQARLKETGQTLNDELESLKSRRTSIPQSSLAIRERICKALDLDENTLPFIGELIQVRENAVDWEGAIERLLHNFALSLLVPDTLYRQVSLYVEQTHLKGRLVYHRVPEHINAPGKHSPEPDNLYHKLEIKTDSEFYAWIERELLQRFDYSCCESMQQFQRASKAISLNGQIKSGQGRHEKDDRHQINDRTRYVLGWQNQTKIDALNQQLDDLVRQLAEINARRQEVDKQQQQLRQQQQWIHDLLRFESWQDIHWQRVAHLIDDLTREKQQLEQSSNLLKQLQQQLEEAEANIRQTADKRNKKFRDCADIEAGIKRDQQLLEQAQTMLNTLSEAQRQHWFSEIEALRISALSDSVFSSEKPSVEGCDHRRQEMNKWLREKKLKPAVDKEARRREALIDGMRKFKDSYSRETEELDVSLAAAHEYIAILKRLRDEDLPRHQSRFQRMLRENTINDIALLNGELEREREGIVDKIARINQSLAALDYNDDTYIRLEQEHNPDTEIRQFREDLRRCLGETLNQSNDQIYSENKFQMVKQLIDRFKGRDGLSAEDQRWTQKVTDVRNWYSFSASERWKSDDEERERYSDSSGKSGGQKEKLAYTILASALAYQFGLEWGETRSRSFRFVMIDEAFGRGSDESARYALKLFQGLNLQLLIVTPLQKIHIIEDFVKTVNYVHNPDGQLSMIRNLSIQQYQEEKALYTTSQNATEDSLS